MSRKLIGLLALSGFTLMLVGMATQAPRAEAGHRSSSYCGVYTSNSCCDFDDDDDDNHHRRKKHHRRHHNSCSIRVNSCRPAPCAPVSTCAPVVSTCAPVVSTCAPVSSCGSSAVISSGCSSCGSAPIISGPAVIESAPAPAAKKAPAPPKVKAPAPKA